MTLKAVLLASVLSVGLEQASAQEVVLAGTQGSSRGAQPGPDQQEPQVAAEPAVVPQGSLPPPNDEIDRSSVADAERQEIVVTGSRIRRDGFSAPVPTAVVTAEQLQTSGYTELSQSLVDLPGVSFGDTVVGQPNGNIQNAGTTTVDLRNLGSNRTLVLIDGRRTVSNAANRNVVSLNTIPQDFVERVEVITGAASAIYGSDAIAGVVNIITESNLQGLRLRGRAQSSLSDGRGAEELTASATFGTKFADDRGYFLVSGSYEQDFGLFATDRRARAGRPFSFNPETNTITEPDLSTDIPGGRFRGGAFFFDDRGLRPGFVQGVNGFNDRVFDTLRIPRRVLATAAKLSFEITPAFKPFVQAQFSDLDTVYERAPIGVRDTTEVIVRDPATGLALPGVPRFSVGRISRTSPLAPAAIRNGAPASGIDFRRRFSEVGNREARNDRDTLRIFTGVNGKLSDKWFYEASYGFGRFRQNQIRTNGVNLRDLRFGLDVETDPATGGLRCRDAGARAAGCVPVNIFGVGSITPEAADYIRADSFFRSEIEQHVAQAYVTGDLFELPGGSVSTAFGVEYREDSASLATDDEVRTGFTTNSGVPSFNDSINVKEAFVELTFPLLRDRPFAHELTLDLAGRVADYSIANVGTVFSYRVGASWAPVEALRLRAQYGTAQRAPDLAELYSPPRDDTDTVIDICSGVTATTAGPVAANCRREPGIAATIAASGVYRREPGTTQSPNGGNLGLEEETGKTFTVGAVLSPRSIPGFNLSVDYYTIKVENAIAAFSNEFILRECYNSSSFPNNQFCALISRSAVDGQLQQIIQQEQNLEGLKVSGLDVRFSYAVDLGAFSNLPGRIDIGADWNHSFENETTFQGLDGPGIDDNNGEFETPEDSVTARFGYEDEGFRFQWRTRWIGPVVSSNERVADAAARGFQDPLFLRFDDYWRHDAFLRFSAGEDDRFRFILGVNNIFNKVGPFVPDGATPDADAGYIPQYGIVGRTGYVGVEVQL